jgi:hypothetical protein
MTESLKASLQGYLEMALLFQGSKSEGLYPVLRLEDGTIYRIHIRRSSHKLVTEALTPWMNQHINIEGAVDDLRGHLRLTLAPDFQASIVDPSTSEDSSLAPTEPKP